MNCPWAYYIKIIIFSALIFIGVSWHGELQASRLRVTWTTTSNNEEGFKIERLVAGLVETTFTVGPQGNSYLDSGLVTGAVYCYRVRAFNSAGESDASNQTCAVAQETNQPAIVLTLSSTNARPGDTLSVTWTDLALGTPTDWIGVYASEAPDTSFLAWMYVSCSTTPGGAPSSRTCPFVLPATLLSGNYQFRFFANDGFAKLGTSKAFVVSTEQAPMANLHVSPTGIHVGATTLAATWNNIARPSPTDWLGLYLPGTPDRDFLEWTYVSCSKTAAAALAAGSCPFALPTTIDPGTYELRLLANDGYVRLATSSTFSISSGRPTVTLNSNHAIPGGLITANWSGISAPTSTDWLGLYLPSTGDREFLEWIYVSCSTGATAPATSGSCSFPLPATLSPGTYELRLFANDGYARLATSSALSVFSLVALSNSGATETQQKRTASQLPASWTDYNLTLTMKADGHGTSGIVFRYQDIKNYYRFSWNQDANVRQLEKVDNGMTSILASDSAAAQAGKTYTVQVIAEGATLTVLLDHVQLFSTTDVTFAEGTIALYTSANTGTTFDDVLVQDLMTGVLLMSADFNDQSLDGWTIIDKGTNDATSAWAAENGTLSQSSKIDGTFALYTARDWTDYRFTGRLRSGGTGAIGAMFRYQDDRNFYRFLWDAVNAERKLEKVQNGVVTTLVADSTSYVKGQTYSFEITASGPNLEILIDGDVIFLISDMTFHSGSVALYSRQNEESIFDHIMLKGLVTENSLLTHDFSSGFLRGWTILGEDSSSWSTESGSLLQRSNIGARGAIDFLETFALYTK